jgi:hypothetical protein
MNQRVSYAVPYWIQSLVNAEEKHRQTNNHQCRTHQKGVQHGWLQWTNGEVEYQDSDRDWQNRCQYFSQFVPQRVQGGTSQEFLAVLRAMIYVNHSENTGHISRQRSPASAHQQTW